MSCFIKIVSSIFLQSVLHIPHTGHNSIWSDIFCSFFFSLSICGYCWNGSVSHEKISSDDRTITNIWKTKTVHFCFALSIDLFWIYFLLYVVCQKSSQADKIPMEKKCKTTKKRTQPNQKKKSCNSHWNFEMPFRILIPTILK